MWIGKLNIYPETCCEVCNEIVHNHIDCPICNKKYASTINYGCIVQDSDNGNYNIECTCGAKFHTIEADPYDATWKQIS